MKCPHLLMISFAIGGASGCASYSGKPIDSRQEASSIVEQREAEGLYVAVKDLSHPRDSFLYFDRDLRAQGYIPVLILLELDRNSQSVFDVRREDVQLCLREGHRLQSVDPTEVASSVGFTHFRSVLGFFLFFPGFFVAASVNEANEQIELDYQQKAIKSIRINPNMRSFKAVVFFKVPPEAEEAMTLEDAFIEAKVYKQGQGGNSPGKCLEFPVHFGK